MAAISWVNGTTADGGTNPTTLSLSVSLTPGNYVFIGVALPSGSSVSSIGDNSTGAYLNVVSHATNLDVEMWVGIVPTVAPTTITVNLAGSPATGFAVLSQYSGSISAIVAPAGANGSSATPGLAPTRAITYANDYAVSVLGWNVAVLPPSITQLTGTRRESGNSTGAATKVGAALVDNTSATAGATLTNDVTLGTSETWDAVIADLYNLVTTIIAVPSGGSLVYEGWPNSTVLVASSFQVTDAPTYVVLSRARPTPFNPEGAPIIVDA